MAGLLGVNFYNKSPFTYSRRKSIICTLLILTRAVKKSRVVKLSMHITENERMGRLNAWLIQSMMKNLGKQEECLFLTKVPKTVRSMSLSRLISAYLRWEPPPKSKSRFFIWHLFGHKFVVIKEFTSVSNQIGCRILCPLFLMK